MYLLIVSCIRLLLFKLSHLFIQTAGFTAELLLHLAEVRLHIMFQTGDRLFRINHSMVDSRDVGLHLGADDRELDVSLGGHNVDSGAQGVGGSLDFIDAGVLGLDGLLYKGDGVVRPREFGSK